MRSKKLQTYKCPFTINNSRGNYNVKYTIYGLFSSLLTNYIPIDRGDFTIIVLQYISFTRSTFMYFCLNLRTSIITFKNMLLCSHLFYFLLKNKKILGDI